MSDSKAAPVARSKVSKSKRPHDAPKLQHGGRRRGEKWEKEKQRNKDIAEAQAKESRARSDRIPPVNRPSTEEELYREYQEYLENKDTWDRLEREAMEEENRSSRGGSKSSRKKRKSDRDVGSANQPDNDRANSDDNPSKKAKSVSLFHATADHSKLSYSTLDSDEEEEGAHDESTNLGSDVEPDDRESIEDERSGDAKLSTSSDNPWAAWYMKSDGIVAKTLQSFSASLCKGSVFTNPLDCYADGKPYPHADAQVIDITKRNEYTFRNPVRGCETDFLVYGKPLSPDRFYQYFMVIRLWDPPEEFPLLKLRGGMKCPKGCSSQCRACRWKATPRRIIDNDNHRVVFLFTRTYRCSGCTMEFMSSSEEALARLDVPHLNSFPFFLSARSGVPVSTVQRIRSLTALGNGPRKIHLHYRELFCETVSVVEKMYYGVAQCLLQKGREKTLREPSLEDPKNEIPRFITRVDDVRGISGVIISESYIKRIFILDSRRRQEFLAFCMTRLDGEILSMDHTFRAAKRIGDSSSKSIHDVMNENGEIRSLVVTHDQSNSVVEQQLEVINHNSKVLNQKEVAVVYADNCCSIRATVTGVFESLRRGTNEKPLYKPDMDHVLYQDLENAFTANLALRDLRNSIAAAAECVLVGFDIEYTNIPEKDRVAGGLGTKVTTIQLAYVDNDDNGNEVFKAIVFYTLPRPKDSKATGIPTDSGLPTALVEVLTSRKVKLCGRSVKGDSTHMEKNFGVKLNDESLCSLEKEFFDSKYPMVTSGNMPLSELSEVVLGYSLNKDDALRRSFTGVKKLTETQAAYCAQDAIISLKLGLSLQKWTQLRKTEDVPASVHDGEVHVCSSRCKLDAIHAMWRVTDSISKEHTYRRLFVVQLVDALMIPYNEDVKLYESKYGSGSYEKDRVFRREFVNKLVRRYIPAEKVLEARLKAILNDFSHAVFNCPKSGDPLLGPKAKEGLGALIRNHLACLEDPPSSVCTLYTEYGKNDVGMPLYYCARGTNNLENFHRKLNLALTSYSLGAEMTDALLAELVSRHNIIAGERRRKNFPKAGHYNHELLYDIETLTKDIYGESVRPSFSTNIGSYKDVKDKLKAEPFGIISCVEADPEYDAKLARLGGKAYLKLQSSDDAYLVAKQKQVVAFRPVNKAIEKYVFKVVCQSYVGNHSALDFSKFAKNWNEGSFQRKCKAVLLGTSNNTKIQALKSLKKYVDGDCRPDMSCGVYMKTAEQLEAYYKVFKSNEELSEMTHLAASNVEELRKKLKGKPSELIGVLNPGQAVEESVNVVPVASSRDLPTLKPTADHLALNADLPSLSIAVNPEQVMTAVTNIHVLAEAADDVKRVRKARTCRRCGMESCRGSTNQGVAACVGVCSHCKEDCADSRVSKCVKLKDLAAVPNIATSPPEKIVLKGAKRGGQKVAKQTCRVCGNTWNATTKEGCRGAVCGEKQCWLKGDNNSIMLPIPAIPEKPPVKPASVPDKPPVKPASANMKLARVPVMSSAHGSVNEWSNRAFVPYARSQYDVSPNTNDPDADDWLRHLRNVPDVGQIPFDRLLGTNPSIPRSKWVCDEIINSFGEILQLFEIYKKPVNASFVILNSQFLSKLAEGYSRGEGIQLVRRWGRRNIGQQQILNRIGVVIPKNSGGMHWSLIVILFQSRCVVHIDSYYGNLDSVTKGWLLDYFEEQYRLDGRSGDFRREDWKTVNHKGFPAQTNGYDCGVFTIMAMISICRAGKIPEVVKDYQESHMPLIRRNMHSWLKALACHVDGRDRSNVLQVLSAMNFHVFAPCRKEVILPNNVVPAFTKAAESNTFRWLGGENKGIETCALLFGQEVHGQYRITDLIIPKQEGTSTTCEMTQDGGVELVNFNAGNGNGLVLLGWIHTHPTQCCFLSSVDLHNHFQYQSDLPEAIAIVVAPADERSQVGIFQLTDPLGMQTLKHCTQLGFHPHQENFSIYNHVAHVTHTDKYDANVHDWRA